MKRFINSLLRLIGLVTIVLLFLVMSGLFLAGHWLQSGDEIDPSKRADAIVVLAGSYFRPLYAADLYNQGVGSVVYVSRAIDRKDRKLLESVDVNLPLQEEIFRRILRNKGVPDNAIRFFGKSLISTAQEGEAFKEAIGSEPKTLVLVTSPYHVRRAEMIFEDALPNCTVLAAGTPYEPFPKKWWTTRTSALNTVNEAIKIFFHLIGGRFESDDVPVSGDGYMKQSDPAKVNPARM